MKTRMLLTALLFAVAAGLASAQISYEQGVKYFTDRNYNEAEKCFNEVETDSPNFGFAQAYKGIMSYRQDNPSQAVIYLAQAVENIAPNDKNNEFWANAYHHLALAQFDCNDSIAGLEALGKAIELQPDKAELLQERGIALQNSKRYSEALVDLEKAAKINSKDPMTFAGLGYTQIGLHNRDKAIEAFNKAAKLDKNNAEQYRSIVAELEKLNPDMSVPTEVTEREIEETDNVQMPSFPGGTQAIKEFIATNVKYPDNTMEVGAHGLILVDCLVSETGKVIDAKVLNSIEDALDKETLRVCKMLPDFVPGTKDGEPAQFWVQVPVLFERPF